MRWLNVYLSINAFVYPWNEDVNGEGEDEDERSRNWRVKRGQAPFSFRKTQGVINEEWRSRNRVWSRARGREEKRREKQRRHCRRSREKKKKKKTRKTQQLVDQRLGPVLSFSALLASLGRLTLLLRLFESAREKDEGRTSALCRSLKSQHLTMSEKLVSDLKRGKKKKKNGQSYQCWRRIDVRRRCAASDAIVVVRRLRR